jgi:hypothetical protein
MDQEPHTSALPGGRSGSPLTCRSNLMFSHLHLRLQTFARKRGPKSPQIASENGLFTRKEKAGVPIYDD